MRQILPAPLAMLLALVLAVAMPAGTARAQTAPGAPLGGLEQITLSEEMVRNFLASFPSLRALGEKYDAEFGADDLVDNPGTLFATMARSQAAMAEFQRTLNAHGFADVEAWMRVGFSMMVAHGWRQSDSDPVSEIDRALAEVQANPAFSAEQKAAIAAQIEAQRALLASFRPLPGNIAVVEKFAAEIDRLDQED